MHSNDNIYIQVDILAIGEIYYYSQLYFSANSILKWDGCLLTWLYFSSTIPCRRIFYIIEQGYPNFFQRGPDLMRWICMGDKNSTWQFWTINIKCKWTILWNFHGNGHILISSCGQQRNLNRSYQNHSACHIWSRYKMK